MGKLAKQRREEFKKDFLNLLKKHRAEIIIEEVTGGGEEMVVHLNDNYFDKHMNLDDIDEYAMIELGSFVDKDSIL